LGVWDWIRGALGMERPAPQGETTAPEAETPAKGVAPKPEESKPEESKASERPERKRKKRKKKRKQRKQPPGWHRDERIEGPDPRIPRKVVTDERPASLLPPDPATEEPPPAVEESPPAVEEPAPAAAASEEREAPPDREPERAAAPAPAADEPARSSPRQRDQATLAWIVVPKFEALLAELDETLADSGASRDALVTARARFVREWRALKPIPASDAARLDAAHDEKLAEVTRRIDATVDPRVEEDKAKVAMRETMIEAAAGLVELPDLKAAIQQAKALQREWRDAPRVERDVAKEQNVRFRAAMDAVFARREEEEAERLVKLEAFVDSAEALSRSEDPERAAEAMKRLQQQWKATGGVRGEKGDEVWTRFRAAADAVFERRRLKREEMHAQSLAARQDLIEEANRLADEGVEDADHTIRDLQRRWRQTGHVPRESADQLWTAFKAACDRIRNPPAMDPTDLGDGQEGLSFNPFAGIEGPDQDG